MSGPVLYTQPGCAESARVRAWLGERGVAFVERGVTDAATAAELAATGVFATPLLVVGPRRALRFRPAELEAALGDEG